MNFVILGTCCLWMEMLDAVVSARIHSGWFKFKSQAPFVTAIDASLLLRGKVYDACVWSCMIYGSET